MLKRKICRVCGGKFMVPPKQASRAYCDKTACQIERKQRNLARDRRHHRLVKRGVKRVSRRARPDRGRRCRRCGCNCYPNYFYCCECHRYVSQGDGFGEESVSAC